MIFKILIAGLIIIVFLALVSLFKKRNRYRQRQKNYSTGTSDGGAILYSGSSNTDHRGSYDADDGSSDGGSSSDGGGGE
jgi:uncharacterized membrane protein YgcG